MKNIFAVLVLLIWGIFSSCTTNKTQLLHPPKHGGVYVVAHRGAHQGIPENSLPAYQKAIDLGADFVEIDVRTTKDGKFVSMHNSSVDSYVEGASGKVRDFSLAELRQLDIGSRVGPEWQGTRIPTFEEILDLCHGKIGIYLDLKDAPIAPLIDIIKSRGMERDILWCLGGFRELDQVQRLCPECILMPDPDAERNLVEIIARYKPMVVAPVWSDFSKSLVETCHAANALVIVDERDRDSWAQALEWGVDGIQTDYPAELIAYLEKR